MGKRLAACVPLCRLLLAVLVLVAVLLPTPQAQTQVPSVFTEPGQTGPSATPVDILSLTDLAYGKGDGEKELLLDLARPAHGKGPFPAIVCIPGGGWLTSDRKAHSARIRKLAEEGYVAVCVSYRTSAEAPFPAAVQDVKCAVRWLRANAEQYQVDPQRIAALGFSAGGHLACMLGTTGGELEEGEHAEYSSRVQAVVSFYGLLDLAGIHQAYQQDKLPLIEGPLVHGAVKTFMGGSDNMTEESLRQASPLYHVSKRTAPTLLLHGTEDALVPVEQSRRYAAELEKMNVEVRLVTLAGAHHNFAGEYEAQALPEVLPFLQRHLGRLPLAAQGW